jgi:tRNA pseudouridine55 synthase
LASGILNVHKAVGPTSFSVVGSLRRLTGVKRVGHGGTLDPAAEGVLPILLGGATRLADFIHEWPKSYRAVVQLGAVSETYDGEGEIRSMGAFDNVRRDQIEKLLPEFTGTISQVPPAFSALKSGGEALYRKARRGEEVRPQPRTVQIDSLVLLEYDQEQGRVGIELSCRRGTYVRSLAHDLGTRLGCGGYLASLVRTAVGPLLIEDSIPLADLMEGRARWQDTVLPPDLPLRGWPTLNLESRRTTMIERGQPVAVPEAGGPGRHRVLDLEGNLVAWGIVDGNGMLQPKAVFSA